MKKFLMLGFCLLASVSVSAQIPTAGEMNLSGDVQSQNIGSLPFNIPTAVTPTRSPVAEQNPASTQTPQRVPQGGGLFPELANVDTSSKQNASSEAIYLVVNDVTIVQPAFNGIAFCTGTMTAENQMNVTLRELSVSLRYGSLDVPLSFGSVPPYGGKQTQPIAWAGENCKNMLDVPQMTVLSCVAPGISKVECEGKIKYRPIETDSKIDNAK